MKRIMVRCPYCNTVLIYKNWFHWVACTPFHWFRKRRMKCPDCGHRAYVVGIRVF